MKWLTWLFLLVVGLSFASTSVNAAETKRLHNVTVCLQGNVLATKNHDLIVDSTAVIIHGVRIDANFWHPRHAPVSVVHPGSTNRGSKMLDAVAEKRLATDNPQEILEAAMSVYRTDPRVASVKLVPGDPNHFRYQKVGESDWIEVGIPPTTPRGHFDARNLAMQWTEHLQRGGLLMITSSGWQTFTGPDAEAARQEMERFSHLSSVELDTINWHQTRIDRPAIEEIRHPKPLTINPN